VSDSTSTLLKLLRLIYLAADIPAVVYFKTIEGLVSVFEAAFKYDMGMMVVCPRIILISPRMAREYTAKRSCCNDAMEFEEEAKIASKYTLRESQVHSPPLADFMHTSGYAFQRLVLLHRSLTLAARAIVDKTTASTLKRSCTNISSPYFPEWKKRAKEELGLRPLQDRMLIMDDTYATLAC
jgi:hypothetical protein